MIIKIDGLLLAGGESRRMRTDKAFLSLSTNQTLIEAQAKQLGLLCHRFYIAANHLNKEVSKRCPEAECIPDVLAGHEGPLSPMLTALRKTNADYLWVMPVDCYGDLSMIKNVLISEAKRKPDAKAIYLNVDGKDQPLIALLRPELHHQLADYLEQGKRAVFKWYNTLPCAVVDLKSDGRFLANLNTPEEAKEIEKLSIL